MDKKTILRYALAIGLSIVLFLAYFLVTSTIGKSNQRQQAKPIEEQKTEIEEKKSETPLTTDITSVIDPAIDEKDISFSTAEYDILFSTKGGVIKSCKLKAFKEADGSLIEVVVSDKTQKYPFELSFGDYNTANDVFSYKEIENEKACEFTRDFLIKSNNTDYIVTLKKRYTFNEEYIINLLVSIDCKESKYLPLDFNNTMYSLIVGPQIGPGFNTKLNSNEYRNYIFFDTERRDVTNDFKEKSKVIDKIIRWIAIEGKYFMVIAYPPKDFIDRQSGFNNKPIEGISLHSSMFFDRPVEKIATIEDKFKFYIGPKKKEILDKYKDYYFDKAAKSDQLLGWLIWILKGALQGLYSIVNNWGIAIIILTLIIKVLFFPITQKGLKSSMRMQGLSPKIEELKAKYKDNQQKLQLEIGGLYKKEGINPLSGCLPMLIQLPIFIALYGLLNDHFELRGAVFIPGWINDLSAPEYIFTLPFTIPFLNVDKLRLLPFFVLATQFVQQKLTPTPSSGASTGKEMKYLMYLLPFVFFFIMYNFPSGLSLYWTMQNILSILNQVYNNVTLKKQKSEQSTAVKK